jgi:hypothetical protein
VTIINEGDCSQSSCHNFVNTTHIQEKRKRKKEKERLPIAFASFPFSNNATIKFNMQSREAGGSQTTVIRNHLNHGANWKLIMNNAEDDDDERADSTK